MMKIQIISSCWNYWRCLNYHLSAIAVDPPQTASVIVSVAYCEQDGNTTAVLDYFRSLQIQNVTWDFAAFNRRSLMRRAIARNHFALRAKGDWLVFTDVDYIYTGSVVDALAAELAGHSAGLDAVLAYTPELMQSVDHASGDAVLREVMSPGVWPLASGKFELSRITRPIGGSQIVSKATAEVGGYADHDPQWHQPCDQWQRTFEDVAFRRYLLDRGAKIVPLKTTGVYRIRHSQCGRENVGCSN